MSEMLCHRCKQTFPDVDTQHQMIFPGSREEPPEWIGVCPFCGSDRIEENLMECPNCKEIALPVPGGECAECGIPTLP